MNRASHKSLHRVSAVAPIACTWLDFAVCEPRTWAGLTSVARRQHLHDLRSGTLSPFTAGLKVDPLSREERYRDGFSFVDDKLAVSTWTT